MLLESTMSTEKEAEALDFAVNGLRRHSPEMSASVLVTVRQRVVLLLAAALVAACAIRFPWGTAVGAATTLTVVYLVTLGDRLYLFVKALNHHPALEVSDEEALSLPDDELPVYTILLPVREEHDIEVLRSVRALEYPLDKLDIRLLLEADDTDTILTATRCGAEEFTQLVLMPVAEPRTKPKALNYGLYGGRGELVTIYDAEDIPDPLQLRKVAAVFRKAPEIDCIQAIIKFHERGPKNSLTRWFTSEYDVWHGYMMPALMRDCSPIPLAGTSNHMRMRTLVEIGGWDPHNVTEDADIGIRLARLGHSTVVIDSVTYEEANSDAINWIRQRSRWYKGFLQTFLVHTRHPILLWRQLGTKRMLRFANVTLGTPLLPIANAVFWWLIPAWVLGQPQFIRHLFPPFTYYAGLVSLIFGNAAVVYMGLIACRVERKPHLALAALFVPFYWVLMAVAAVKACLQLLFQPTYWEKTQHVLGREPHDT
jgi:glycosyltransferase XagB